ncbi:uncharacterized protein LOC105695431 [Orussus abietinus]|uniref:uncharacterized protein LOC105695431 n=1 Tax=Orussus abietinus TaxID=222816 RepID=UPI000625F195|nr:uncharacterized protein LOC105695431 [Orussus abietinus]
MYPTATARPSRSSLQTPGLSAPSCSPLLHQQRHRQHRQQQQQHQQQHVFYGPIATLQHCSASLNSTCLYSGSQRAPTGAPGPAALQPPVVASQAVCRAPFGEHFAGGSSLTLIPQARFFAPGEVPQTFCFLQDRSSAAGGPQQPQQRPGPYYGVSAAVVPPTASTGNPGFHLPSASSFAMAAFQGAQVPGVVSMPPANTARTSLRSVGNETQRTTEVPPVRRLDVEEIKSEEEWRSGAARYGPLSSSSGFFEASESSPPPGKGPVLGPGPGPEEPPRSGESSTSFDFTIEAERMVSALCNTASSNDLREPETSPLGGGGDHLSERSTTSWFADYGADYASGSATKSVGTQTKDLLEERHYAELIRGTIYRGCNEAEAILSSSEYARDPRHGWLAGLSSATRTALTKSSTCFPVFAGDRVLVHDLVNALVRIGNGWLILDNYINKRHYPSLNEKYDPELTGCFRAWEASTHELLGNLVRSFLWIEKNRTTSPDTSEERDIGPGAISFPGDVSLYVTSDLFGGSTERRHRRETDAGSTSSGKPRGKWTVPAKAPDPGKAGASRCSLTKEFRTLRDKVMEGRGSSAARRSRSATYKLPGRERSVFGVVSTSGTGYSTGMTEPAFAFRRNATTRVEALFVDHGSGVQGLDAVGASAEAAEALRVAAVPRNRMTLLSQIEPNTSGTGRDPEGMAANLSAWFASMRHSSPLAGALRAAAPHDLSRSALDLGRQLHLDANRQLHTLRNMQSIQTAPWNACNFLNDPNPRAAPGRIEEYDSSEDVRVYMKPGSYNVPKKRHQHRPHRRHENSSSSHLGGGGIHNQVSDRFRRDPPTTRAELDEEPIELPPAPTVVANPQVDRQPSSLSSSPPPISSSSSPLTSSPPPPPSPPLAPPCRSSPPRSPTSTEAPLSNLLIPTSSSSEPRPWRVLQRSDHLIRENHGDVTWKAACASAEILLEALNVKDRPQDGTSTREECNARSQRRPSNSNFKTKSKRGKPKCNPKTKCKMKPKPKPKPKPLAKFKSDPGVEPAEEDLPSYEVSEEDSGSGLARKPSPRPKRPCAQGCRSNVRTDSWLIRTLDNAGIQDERAGRRAESSESLEGSPGAEERTRSFDGEVAPPGRATYSETVRRRPRVLPNTLEGKETPGSKRSRAIEEGIASSTALPLRKDVAREMEARRTGREISRTETEDGRRQGRDSAPDETNSGDRGWSVWYGSRRRQSLSPLAPTETVWRITLRRHESDFWKVNPL